MKQITESPLAKWRKSIGKPLVIQGDHFRTETLSGGEVRITWSKDGETWDALDFWTVPASDVDRTIAKVREGFEL